MELDKFKGTEIIAIENGLPVLNNGFAVAFKQFEEELKQLNDLESELRKKIKEEMEKHGIKKIDDEVNGIMVAYTEEVTGLEKFDAKAFREENPDLYDEYVSFTGKRASSIRVTVK